MFLRFFLTSLAIVFLCSPLAEAANPSDCDERCRQLTEEVKKRWQEHSGFENPLWFFIVFDEKGRLAQVKFDETLSPFLEVDKHRAATVENLSNYVNDEYSGVRAQNKQVTEVSAETKNFAESFLAKLVLNSDLFCAARSLPTKKKIAMHVALCNRSEDVSAYSDDLNLLPWLEEASKKTHKVWYPPKCLQKARVTLRVNRDGSVSDVRVTPPVDFLRDPAALKAVHSAAPYKPLPAGAPEFIVVKFVLGWVWPPTSGKFRSF